MPPKKVTSGKIHLHAHAKFVGHTPTVAIRSYFSFHHLYAAALFSRLSGQIEAAHSGPSKFDKDHRAYVVGAVTSSVSFLEACINELFCDSVESSKRLASLGSAVKDAMAKFWGLGVPRTASYPILNKYQIALAIAGMPLYDKSRQPYQDVVSVDTLRNALVHYEPEWMSSGAKPHKFEQLLKGRFSPCVLFAGSGNTFYPDHCLGYGCARWAVESSLAFTDDFYQRLGVPPYYDHLRKDLALPTH